MKEQARRRTQEPASGAKRKLHSLLPHDLVGRRIHGRERARARHTRRAEKPDALIERLEALRALVPFLPPERVARIDDRAGYVDEACLWAVRHGSPGDSAERPR